MNESNKTGLIIAFVVVVILFLIFGGWAMTGSFMNGGTMGGGGMMGDGMTGRGSTGGFSWVWFPTLITLGIGVFLGWIIFGKK